MFAKMVGRRATALATSLAVVIGLAITPAFTATAAEGDEPVITPQTIEVVAEETPPADLPAPAEEAPAAPAPVEELPADVPAVEVPGAEVVEELPSVEASTPPGPESMMRSSISEPMSLMAAQATGISPVTIGPFTVGEPIDIQFSSNANFDFWSGAHFPPSVNLSDDGHLTGSFLFPGTANVTVSTVKWRFGIPPWRVVEKRTYSIVVKPAITTEFVSDATVGDDYEAQIWSTNPYSSISFNYDSTLLPPGLTLTTVDRGILFERYLVLSGEVDQIPDNVTAYSFWVTSTVNGVTSDPKWFSITIGNTAPSWGTVTLPDATVGVQYPDTQVTATGKVTLTYTATGLPAGLQLSPSGLITGMATGDVSYAPIQRVPVTITADNGKTTSTTVNLVVKSPASVTTTALPDAWLTQHYNAAITTAGPAVALTATDLPAGLNLIGNVDGYSIDGKPTAAGDFTIKVTATNAAGSSVFPVTVTVNAAPVFSTKRTLPNATTGMAYSADIDATGASVTYTLLSGPAGTVMDSATGVLSGWTPADEMNVQVRVRAQNLSGSVARTFTIRPFAVPTITVAPLSHGVVGESYSDEIEFTGRSANVKKTTGSLPPGLTLERNGELHGTPTAAGDYTFKVRAQNWAGVTTELFTVSVTVPAMQISTGSILRGGSLTVTGNGYVPGDQLEFWLHSTPVLLGTVTSVDGTFTKTVTIPANVPAGAHDLVVTGAQSGTQSMPLTVTAPPAPPAASQQPRATTQSQSPALTVTPSDESSTVDDADEADDSEVEETEADDELPTLPQPEADAETTPVTPVNWTGLLVAGFALLLAALALWYILWRRRRATES